MAEPGFHNPFLDGAALFEQHHLSAPLPFGPDLDPAELSFLPPSPDKGGGFFLPDLAFADVFDLDIDLSFEDFLLGDAKPSPGQEPDGSGVLYSSPHQSSGEPLDSVNQDPLSPDSGKTSAASGVTDREAKAEQKIGCSLKRKQDKEEEEECASFGAHSHPNSNSNGSPRSSKFLRSEEASSPCVFTAGSEEDDKRKTRLMRNRESAQLSRQRKKQYMEELEEKVKGMHSTIKELNSKISYIMAENASLRQQLVGTGAPSAAAIYPAPPGMAPMHFPWASGYALARQVQVPLVPIPRLKPQQPAAAPKTKKSEHKKGAHKTKKVAGVSLLGLLLFMLFSGAVVPGVNNIFGGNRAAIGVTTGRILSVSGGGDLNTTDIIGLFGGKIGLDNHGTDKLTDARYQNGELAVKSKPNGIGSMSGSNSSEILPAFLYVPRNGKHVKLNGNLIIQSVLASEKAVAQMETKKSASKEETSLVIADNARSSALVVPQAGQGHEINQRAKTYRTNTDFDDIFKNFRSISADGPLQQWFREGMTGPVLSSGMCTEVFQFDVSPSSAHLNGNFPATSVINASSIVNVSENIPPTSVKPRMKNRRILYPEAIPLCSGTCENGSEQFEKASESSNDHGHRPDSSIVVSVLVDPREAGDGDTDARISAKLISHIFVVVLLDSVKYVTYSCVLPFKSSSPFL